MSVATSNVPEHLAAQSVRTIRRAGRLRLAVERLRTATVTSVIPRWPSAERRCRAVTNAVTAFPRRWARSPTFEFDTPADSRMRRGSMSDEITFYDDIEGYCGRLSYRAGRHRHAARLDACRHATTSRSSGGAPIATSVWSAPRSSPASSSQPPADADARAVDWPASVEIPIRSDWRSGFYLVTLTAHDASPGRDVAARLLRGRPRRRR